MRCRRGAVRRQAGRPVVLGAEAVKYPCHYPRVIGDDHAAPQPDVIRSVDVA